MKPVALVLDFDRQTADHLCQLLSLLDVSSIPAYTWRAGMLALNEDALEGGSIELLFLGISGLDETRPEQPVVSPLQRFGRDIPVILVAPAGCENLLERMKEFEARAMITKPVSLDSVANVLMALNIVCGNES